MDIVSVQEVSRQYGTGENSIFALDKVSFTVRQGEFVAVTGRSGSGKSTLLHIIGAVDKPSAGRVVVEGEDLTHMKEKQLAVFRRRKIGFVFQSFNLVPVLTAEENIMLPLMLDERKPDKEYLRTLIQILDLDDRRKHLPNQLSGGQQQRVAVARALAAKPAIVLADEPTGNLDTRNSRELMSMLTNSVRQFNQTLIVITHDPAIAAKADRVIELEDGRLTGDAPAAPYAAPAGIEAV